MDEWIYKIAITLIPGVGNISSKEPDRLLRWCRSGFRERKHLLLRIPGIGEQTVNAVMNQQVFEQAEQELEFIQKYSIRPLFYLDPDYPARLKLCNDSPVILYYKGAAVLNNARAIALVGTRNATEYGKEMCKRIIDGLKESGCLVISGLAYGIDTWSHKAALESDLPTVGVLGHGLDRIYPYANRSWLRE
jgi:DNA processing protein